MGNRLGKKRLIPLDDSGSEAPTAESRVYNLPSNQPVRTPSPPTNNLTDLLPAPAGMSASNDEREGSQVAGGSNNSQQTEDIHSDPQNLTLEKVILKTPPKWVTLTKMM